MARRTAQDIAEAASLFDQLPRAAADELLVEMAVIGRELRQAQYADAPKATGAMASDLAVQVIAERLKLRVGILGGGTRRWNGRTLKNRLQGPIYARIVEGGRVGQTVRVTRRIKAANRKLTGNNKKGQTRSTIFRGASNKLRRRGPNKGTPIGSPYKLRVKAKEARPFVAQPLLLQTAEAHLADYWVYTLARLEKS
ncbi:hypothetical protein [uncultured Sphingomonas sp.]|uniref:hypothetical protein n=1 Tax=uncultured Sphingomonas sp. TaxID=158754 RepID=UPI0025835505|nr:hypothetical protein [uncultured Sphingomonas sp.]